MRVAGGPKAALFHRLWTLEEALIEALRTGFSPDPSRFEVQRPMLGGERSAVFLFPHRPFDSFWLEDPGAPRFVAATQPQLPLGEVGWA